MTKESEKLAVCLKKNCKNGGTAMDLRVEMEELKKQAVALNITDEKKVTEVKKKLLDVADKFEKYKFDAEADMCMLKKCSGDYKAMIEQDLKVTANSMRDTVRMLEKLGQPKPSSAPSKTSKPSSAPSKTSKPSSAPSKTSKPSTAPSKTSKPSSAPSKTSKQSGAGSKPPKKRR